MSLDFKNVRAYSLREESLNFYLSSAVALLLDLRMYIFILIHGKIYSIKLNIMRCIRKRHLNIILKFIKVKTKLKFQKLFEV